MGNIEMTFCCPNCGSSFARLKEEEINLQSGHVFTCDLCDQYVIFEAYSVKEYTDRFSSKLQQEAVA